MASVKKKVVKKAAKKTTKTVAKKKTVKKAVTKKVAPKKILAKKSLAKKTSVKKVIKKVAKKVAAKKAVAKKAIKKTTAKAVKKVISKKPVKKAAVKKAVVAKKIASKKAIAKKAVAKKAVVKRAAPQKALTKPVDADVAVVDTRLAVPQDRPQGIAESLLGAALAVLDERQADDIFMVDLVGKSSVADYVIIASGRAAKQIVAISDYLRRAFEERGAGQVRIEGLSDANWVLVDAGDVIVHLFRPEVRNYYDLDSIWKRRAAGGADEV